MRNFLNELRRRNVLRVAAAYALTAWIIIEAGSVLLPTFGGSDRLFQIYVIVVIAGFVVSVVLAWLFEWTPEGVKLDRKIEADAPLPRRSHHLMNYAIIALLAVALIVSVTFNVRDVSVPVASSIAVLPFTSRSTNPENELFADGIHDDLLTRLASIKALKVISRTSVMGYRDTSKNLRQIGDELGVETILEGAVQRVGDSVRINMQLIDAVSDEHIWAATYERRLTMENIFSIQREISEAVASALQATLSPGEQVRVAATPTSDLRAYRLYKEAKANLYQRQLETLRDAREQFQEALRLDPNFAEAHAGLAESTILLWINHNDLPEHQVIEESRTSLDNALRLDPDLADAYAIRGLLDSTLWSATLTGTRNVDAEAAFRRAIALNPNHASAYMWFASLRNIEERLDEAIELYQKSLELDPLARIPYSNLPQVYAKKGQHREAMQLWLEAVRIHHDWPTVYQYIAVELWGLGRFDEAYAWHAKALELAGGPQVGGNLDIAVMLELGEFERAGVLLDRYPESHMFYPAVGGFNLMLDEKFGEAARYFEELVENDVIPGKFLYDLISDNALISGDLETAREYALLRDPLLQGDTARGINRTTSRNALKLAFIEQQRGRNATATEMLTQTLDVLRGMPRLGTFGFGIRDVQIYALLGRKEEALAAFRDAIDAGYRGSLLFDGWPLFADPYIESISADPRFLAMLDELDGYLALMRDRLLEAEAKDNLAGLRAAAGAI
jgi:TolB-like protein/Flp pilus assembly protein TadD